MRSNRRVEEREFSPDEFMVLSCGRESEGKCLAGKQGVDKGGDDDCRGRGELLSVRGRWQSMRWWHWGYCRRRCCRLWCCILCVGRTFWDDWGEGASRFPIERGVDRVPRARSEEIGMEEID
jgi:hypothetical protein